MRLQADVTSYFETMMLQHQRLQDVSASLATALTVSSDILGSMLPLHVLHKLELRALQARPHFLRNNLTALMNTPLNACCRCTFCRSLQFVLCSPMRSKYRVEYAERTVCSCVT